MIIEMDLNTKITNKTVKQDFVFAFFSQFLEIDKDNFKTF